MTRLRAAFVLLLVTAALLFVFGCVRPSEGLPPIPRSVPSQLGPVRVVWKDSLADAEGNQLWGGYAPALRVIFLNTLLRSGDRAYAWVVLRHEIVHLTLQDAGLHALVPPQFVQALADALAARQVAEMLIRWP